LRDQHVGAVVDGTPRIVDAAYLFPTRHAGLAQDVAVSPPTDGPSATSMKRGGCIRRGPL
jgi:hypothetical protein